MTNKVLSSTAFSLMRGNAVVAGQAHNLSVEGAIPSRATKNLKKSVLRKFQLLKHLKNMETHIMDRIHNLMNEFFSKTKGMRPKFLYLGSDEYAALKLSEGIFCPSKHRAQITKNSIFGMTPIKVQQDNFLEVG